MSEDDKVTPQRRFELCEICGQTYDATDQDEVARHRHVVQPEPGAND